MHYYYNAEDYISHHGILGQKWGKRNGPPYPLGQEAHSASEKKAGWKKSLSKKAEVDRTSLKALYKTKSANLDKWGKDENHNVLYLSGISGSGKSTLAIQMGKRFDADVIHLDYYFNQMSDESRKEYQSKEFNKHLDQKAPKWRGIPNNKWADGAKGVDWKTIDEFADAIESYGKEQYKKGRKVIAEGVELMDDTVHVGRDFYKDKPYAMMSTSVLKSHIRGNRRDGMTGLDFFYRLPMYMKTSKLKSDAVNELSLKGKKAVDMDRTIADIEGKTFDKYWDEQFMKAMANERR